MEIVSLNKRKPFVLRSRYTEIGDPWAGLWQKVGKNGSGAVYLDTTYCKFSSGWELLLFFGFAFMPLSLGMLCVCLGVNMNTYAACVTLAIHSGAQ